MLMPPDFAIMRYALRSAAAIAMLLMLFFDARYYFCY